MAVKYRNQHEVTYYECDVNQTMTLPAMISVAIKASEEQSDLLGRGTEFVNNLGLGWVITNYQIKVNRLPQVGEVINVTTQAMEYNKYFCYRHFWLTDQAENELVKIEAVFVLMNLENRKLSSVSEEVIAPYESEKVSRIRRYPKIEKIQQGQMLPFRVRFYDIDSNRHVNNAIYFNWLINVLDYDFLTTFEPLEVNIRFDKEVEYGHEVESHYEIIATDNGKMTRHEIRLGETLCAEANISWRAK